MRPGPLLAMTIVASGAVAGCAGTEWRAAQTARAVFDPASERYWVTGNYGFAAEGRAGKLTRADYEEPDGAPDWAWDTMMSPGGFVVELEGLVYLFTHGGQVLRRDGARWTQLDVDLVPDQDSEQINDAFVGPDGRLVLHVHSQLIFLGDRAGLERGVLVREPTPSFYTWIGHVDGVLHGLGWDETGNVRALHRRTGPRRWEVITRLPINDPSDSSAIFAFGDRGDVAVVLGGEIAVVDRRGAARTATVEDIVGPRHPRAPLQIAGDAPAPLQVPEAAPVPLPLPAPTPAPTPTPSGDYPGPERAPGARAPAPYKLRGVFPLRAGHTALQLDGAGSEVIAVVGRDGVRFFSCDILQVRRVVAVIEGRDRLFAITDRASVVELGADGACGEPQPPLLPE
jgi:hypothetical protein